LIDLFNDFYNQPSQTGRPQQRRARAPAKKVSVVTLSSGQKVVFVKPYIIPNVRNGRHIKERPTIWIEAALEARDQMAVSVALNFIDYLINDCSVNCIYNYAIAPLIIGADAYTYASVTDKSWRKTRQDIGDGQFGVNLLENFKHGNWSKGNSDKSNQKYRGESPMSAPETQYQVLKNATAKYNRLSVTFSSDGGKLGHPFAHSGTKQLSEKSKYTTVLNEYKTAAANSQSGVAYNIGSFAGTNYEAYGHPLDYNYAQYKNGFSFNVAFGETQDKAYIVKNLDEFTKGLNAVIRKLKTEDSWAV